MQLQLQFQTPLLPVELFDCRRVPVKALGGAVSRPDVQLLPLQINVATGGSRIDEQSARFVYPRGRWLLLRLSTGERERSIKVTSTTGGPRVVVRPPPTERTAWFLSDVVGQIGLNRGDERSLIRILHMTARLGREVVRAAFGLFAELDVASAPRAVGEALLLVEEQIRHVDVGRVSRVYHRRRPAAVSAASHIIVVIVVINIRGDAGGGTGGADSGGDGGASVPRPWRWRRGLSQLSRPQSRAVGSGTGAAGDARTRRPGDARTRSRRWKTGDDGSRTCGGCARLTGGDGPATRVLHARTQPRAARRRVGAEVTGEPRDRIENLREAASRRRAAYLVHRPS